AVLVDVPMNLLGVFMLSLDGLRVIRDSSAQDLDRDAVTMNVGVDSFGVCPVPLQCSGFGSLSGSEIKHRQDDDGEIACFHVVSPSDLATIHIRSPRDLFLATSSLLRKQAHLGPL